MPEHFFPPVMPFNARMRNGQQVSMAADRHLDENASHHEPHVEYVQFSQTIATALIPSH